MEHLAIAGQSIIDGWVESSVGIISLLYGIFLLLLDLDGKSHHFVSYVVGRETSNVYMYLGGICGGGCFGFG
jgi:hypothetical protein